MYIEVCSNVIECVLRMSCRVHFDFTAEICLPHPAPLSTSQELKFAGGKEECLKLWQAELLGLLHLACLGLAMRNEWLSTAKKS